MLSKDALSRLQDAAILIVDSGYGGHEYTSTTPEDVGADVIAEAPRLVGDSTSENG
jgi:hypothetical protein